MFDAIKSIFKKEETEEIDANVKLEVKNLPFKLETCPERIVAKLDEVEVENDECSMICEPCFGKGYLQKNIKLLYICKECYGVGKKYWIDRFLTASKVNKFEMESRERICMNIHTLMYELKQEAAKINSVAIIEIKQIDPKSVSSQELLSHINWYGCGKIQKKDEE